MNEWLAFYMLCLEYPPKRCTYTNYSTVWFSGCYMAGASRKTDAVSEHSAYTIPILTILSGEARYAEPVQYVLRSFYSSLLLMHVMMRAIFKKAWVWIGYSLYSNFKYLFILSTFLFFIFYHKCDYVRVCESEWTTLITPVFKNATIQKGSDQFPSQVSSATSARFSHFVISSIMQ